MSLTAEQMENLNRMHADMLALRTQVDQQRQQLQVQAQQLASPPSSSPGSAHVQPPFAPRTTVPPAPTFDGSASSDADLWLYQMANHFFAAQTPENAKTSVAITSLKAAALTWARSLYPDPRTTNFDDFSNAFRTHFHSVSGVKQARSIINTIKQYDSAGAYIGKFLEVVQRISDMAEADKIQYFINGLKRFYQIKVVEANVATLHEAIDLVQRLDAVARILPQNNKTNRNYNFINRAFQASPSSSGNADKMELDNINQDVGNTDGDNSQDGSQLDDSASSVNNIYDKNSNNNRRVPNLSKEEFDRCMKNNMCFKCKRPGHLARNCNVSRPNNSKFTNSKNGQGQRQ